MGYSVCLAVVIAMAIPAAALALPSLSANPANKLLKRGIDPIQYDKATKCNGGKVFAGTMAMVHWLEKNASGVNWGEYRCEMWGKGQASIHSAGRAIDWHPSSMAAGRELVRLLLAPDKAGNTAALARRMGVQGLIFDCKAWFGNWSGEMGNYSYCYDKKGKRKRNLDPTQAHMNHVHIELNMRGARKSTTFWNATVDYPTQTPAPTPTPQAPVKPQTPALPQTPAPSPTPAPQVPVQTPQPIKPWRGNGQTGGGQYDSTGGAPGGDWN